MSSQYKYTNYDVGSAVPGDIIRWTEQRYIRSHGITETWIVLNNEIWEDMFRGNLNRMIIITQTGRIKALEYDPNERDWTNYELIK